MYYGATAFDRSTVYRPIKLDCFHINTPQNGTYKKWDKAGQ
jgi:hypothetical protein